ncbi:MAG TPA: ABC transporter substrate-binding protein, partial [Enterobacter sp.]|nr:ABC transporter substrate-binding protein [Enterobacter sp.]
EPLFRSRQLTMTWFRHECVPKISGTPPPPRPGDGSEV